MTNLLDKIEICDLGIATRCNFRCKMCRSWQDSGCPDAEMSNADWKGVLEQLHRLLPADRKVIFSGSGEALLREGVDELLCLAAAKFKVGLNSNGYLIDEPTARLIARNVEAISISLDGATPQTHDSIRGKPGAYAAAVGAIERLRRESESLIINVSTVILADNVDEIIDLAQWVDRRDINGIIFQAVSMLIHDPSDPHWYKNKFSGLWPQDTKKVAAVIDRLIDRKRSGGKIVNSFKQLERFKTYFLDPERAIEGLHCEAERALKIDTTGNIRICFLSDPVGNVRTVPLEDILRSGVTAAACEKALLCRTPCHFLINCFHD